MQHGDVVTRLTREELYGRVWERPMRVLAQEFGISDVALAKTCRRAEVPVPGRGYWAKKAAGKPVRRPPLPPLKQDRNGTSDIELHRTSPRPSSEPVSAQIEFESRPENRILVKDSLRAPHPLVRTTLGALEGATSGRIEGYPANWKVRHLDVEVSKPLLRRALRIMDAVINAFEERRWEVSLGRDDRNTYVVILGQRIPFGIREPRRQIPVEPSARRAYDPVYREEPTGRLALVLREYWGRSIKKSILETERRPLEDRLNDFMVAATRLAQERADWERRRAEAEERRRAEERERLEKKRQREAEAARIGDLEEQARRLEGSRLILDLVAAVRTGAEDRSLTGYEPVEQWAEWATAHAQQLDPVAGLLQALVRPRTGHDQDPDEN